MKFKPADCVAERVPLAIFSAIHDPEVFTIVKDLHKRADRPLILVTGPSGVGKTSIVERGLAPRLTRLGNQLRHGRVSAKIDDTSSTLVAQCIREIWSHHPDLNRHVALRSDLARKQRNRLLELSESDPVRAGKQLFAILRGLEGGKGSHLRDSRFMLHIDGLERLYENRVGGERGDPFVPVFGPTADPFGFIRELKLSKSLVLVLSYRDWVRESIRQAFLRSEITGNQTLRYLIDWPNGSRVSSMISRTVLESKIGRDNFHASEIASKLVREFLKASPACVQHVQKVLATAGERGQFDVYLSTTAENYYQSLPSEIRGGVARIVQRFSSGARALPAREISNDPSLWKVANEMTDGGLLCLSGCSLDTAEFSLVSGDLLKTWDRAVKWSFDEAGAESSPESVRQMDHFENHALSWDSTGRSAELLLHVDESINKARLLLAKHEEKSFLSPLTVEFLQKSITTAEAKKSRRAIILNTGMATIVAVAVVIGLSFLYVRYSKSKSTFAMIPAPQFLPDPEVRNDDLAPSPQLSTQPISVVIGEGDTGAMPISKLDLDPAIHESTKEKEPPVLDPELVELSRKIAGFSDAEHSTQPGSAVINEENTAATTVSNLDPAIEEATQVNVTPVLDPKLVELARKIAGLSDAEYSTKVE